MNPEDRDLADLANAVSEGAPVDWSTVGESRGLSGLKLIEQLTAAYRGGSPSRRSSDRDGRVRAG